MDHIFIKTILTNIRIGAGAAKKEFVDRILVVMESIGPSKTFIWRLLRKWISLDNYLEQKWLVLDFRCYCYGSEAESSNHLLL